MQRVGLNVLLFGTWIHSHELQKNSKITAYTVFYNFKKYCESILNIYILRPQSWMQHCWWCLTRLEYRGRITSLGEERLRELRLLSQEKTRLWDDLIAAFHYLKGTYRKDGLRLFSRAHGIRTSMLPFFFSFICTSC